VKKWLFFLVVLSIFSILLTGCWEEPMKSPVAMINVNIEGKDTLLYIYKNEHGNYFYDHWKNKRPDSLPLSVKEQFYCFFVISDLYTADIERDKEKIFSIICGLAQRKSIFGVPMDKEKYKNSGSVFQKIIFEYEGKKKEAICESILNQLVAKEYPDESKWIVLGSP